MKSDPNFSLMYAVPRWFYALQAISILNSTKLKSDTKGASIFVASLDGQIRLNMARSVWQVPAAWWQTLHI